MTRRAGDGGGFDAVGVGVAVRDLTVLLGETPRPDSKVRARAFAESGGGPIPTALVTMARLGDRALLAGAIGDDAAGAFVLEDLRREGVDAGSVAVRPGLATPTSVILVGPEGARTVCEWGQTDLPFGAPEAAALAGILDQCRILLADARLPEAQVEAARRARRSGALVMLDCGHPRPGVEELLALADVAILSHTYPRTLHGDRFDPARFVRDLGSRLARDGRRIAGLTLGRDGCIVAEGAGEPLRLRGHEVRAVDTTGAGDVFHGAFAHALLKGEGAAAAARFANAAAAITCEGLTGRAPLPPEPRIRDLAGGL